MLELERYLVILLAIACSETPSRVYVPGPSFSQSIHLATAQGERATIRVSQPLVLHAERETGPWVAAASDSLAPDSCWLGSKPPERESEVADNLRWLVDPPGRATFNIGYRVDHTREVRFSVPGVYRLTARSAAWCSPPYEGNTLTVEVLAD